ILVNYAFLELKYNDQNLYVPTTTDAWADYDKRFTTANESVNPPDSWDNGPNSPKYFVGGWTGSKHFSDAMISPQSREAFVYTLINLFDRFPGLFNRVDIDWEYISPAGNNWGDSGNKVRAEDPQNFAEFLRLLRYRLNQTGRQHYEISACVAGDSSKFDILPLRDMCEYLDTINVMTYDLSSSSYGPCPAGHHTNLKSTPYAKLSVEASVTGLLQRGVPPHKIVVGVAFYSRGFANTNGLGHPSHGLVSDKSWEDGVCDFKHLPRSGATEYWDDQAKASYSYDPSQLLFGIALEIYQLITNGVWSVLFIMVYRGIQDTE
ncbi:hypothetical protein HK096_007144, partial [Nowakowskiella sp. JEL0078]